MKSLISDTTRAIAFFCAVTATSLTVSGIAVLAEPSPETVHPAVMLVADAGVQSTVTR
jgi:hypothetical protein